MHDYSKNSTNTSARDSMPMHSGLQLQTILCLLMWHLLVIGWNIITQEIKGGARVPAAPPLATPLIAYETLKLLGENISPYHAI